MDTDIKKIVDEKMKQYYEPIPRAVVSGDMTFNEFIVKNDIDLKHPINKVFGFVDWFIKYCGIIYMPVLFVFSLAMLFWIFA